MRRRVAAGAKTSRVQNGGQKRGCRTFAVRARDEDRLEAAFGATQSLRELVDIREPRT